MYLSLVPSIFNNFWKNDSYLTRLYHLAMLVTLYFQPLPLHEGFFTMYSLGTPPTPL